MNRFFDRLKTTVYNSWLHPRHLSLSARLKSVEMFEPFVKGTILDVGCGRKPYRSVFQRATRHVGIDLAGSMHGNKEVDIFASAMTLPFAPESFDAILCTEVLEHTSDPATAVEELARVVRKNGYVMITVPLLESLHEEPYDYFRFTKHGLAKLVVNTELEIIQLLPLGGTWRSFGQQLSLFIYQALGSKTGLSGVQIPRPLLGPPIVLICAFIQMIAAGLDTIWFDEAGTMGYALLASKT